ncbi:MAG: hypothetical protein NKF70_12270 [Methanobacterium sp. ERen5]|nr:MAG: hypothetical protein NKF70_12270 [Methanobacterium sp. ERen5]
MDENLKFILYFLIGGSILALVAYLGSKDRGVMASFLTGAPIMTLLSVIAIYFESGNKCASDYLTGLLYLTPAWIIFLTIMLYLMANMKIIPSLIAGTIIYMIIATLTITLKSIYS